MILRQLCLSKIHRLKVTEACIDYEGSITIDKELLDAAGMLPGEKVQVVDINNGQRFETYTISGPAGSGTVCLNGGAARMGVVNDLLIVISYALADEESAKNIKAKVVLVDENNRVRKVLEQ
ncbi:MAG: aspartate 1-decarboxylase [Candidatus Margulisiibacteriota bacterium]